MVWEGQTHLLTKFCITPCFVYMQNKKCMLVSPKSHEGTLGCFLHEQVLLLHCEYSMPDMTFIFDVINCGIKTIWQVTARPFSASISTD